MSLSSSSSSLNHKISNSQLYWHSLYKERFPSSPVSLSSSFKNVFFQKAKETIGWSQWDIYTKETRNTINHFKFSWIPLLLPSLLSSFFGVELSLQQWLYYQTLLITFCFFHLSYFAEKQCETIDILGDSRTIDTLFSPPRHNFYIFTSFYISALHMTSVFTVFYICLYLSTSFFFSPPSFIILLVGSFCVNLMKLSSINMMSKITYSSITFLFFLVMFFGKEETQLESIMEHAQYWIFILIPCCLYSFLQDIRLQRIHFHGWEFNELITNARKQPYAPLSKMIFPLLKCIIIPYLSFFHLITRVVEPFSPFSFALFFLQFQICGMFVILFHFIGLMIHFSIYCNIRIIIPIYVHLAKEQVSSVINIQ